MRVDLTRPISQGAVALGLTLVACVPWLALPLPVAPAGMGVLLLGLGVAIRWPFAVCLTFALLSCFRIHEAVPVLAPLKLPLLFGGLSLWATVWHVILTRNIKTFWPKEAKALAWFFVIITVGMLFAMSRPLAWSYWNDTIVKIVSITLALTWITKQPRQFEWAARGIILSGSVVAVAAISNKLHGIGLVEGSRVTVGRDIDSPLGDPNLLALTLLFPMSFAVALAFAKSGVVNRALGITGASLGLLAIVYTQSRGALFGLIAVLGVMGWRKVKSRTAFIVGGLLIAALLYVGMGLSERVSGGAAEMADEAAESRIQAWRTALNMAARRPLTGVGLNNFAGVYSIFASVWNRQDYTAHSIWFLVLGESGIPGFIAFSVMIWHGLHAGFETLAKLPQHGASVRLQAVCLGLVAGLVGYCVCGSFLSASYAWPLYIGLAFTSALARFCAQGAPKRTADPDHAERWPDVIRADQASNHAVRL